MKNILVASHPRSGTHLLIDLIRNNVLGYEKWYLTTGGLERRNKKLRLRQSLLNRLEKAPRVIKTHLRKDDFDSLITNCKLARELLANAIYMYIHRAGMDVLSSHYLRMVASEGKRINFLEFMEQHVGRFEPPQTRPVYWQEHVKSWCIAQNVVLVKFEDIITNPNRLLKRFQDELGLQLTDQIVDVRLSEESVSLCSRFGIGNQLPDGVSRTSVSFRKGKIGDSINYFTERHKSYFESQVTGRKFGV